MFLKNRILILLAVEYRMRFFFVLLQVSISLYISLVMLFLTLYCWNLECLISWPEKIKRFNIKFSIFSPIRINNVMSLDEYNDNTFNYVKK